MQKRMVQKEIAYVNIIQHKRFVWWITKAADTQLGYVILTAFLRQQWSHESALMLCLNVHFLSS
jgi:predicted cobalt transporter CbtA